MICCVLMNLKINNNSNQLYRVQLYPMKGVSRTFQRGVALSLSDGQDSFAKSKQMSQRSSQQQIYTKQSGNTRYSKVSRWSNLNQLRVLKEEMYENQQERTKMNIAYINQIQALEKKRFVRNKFFSKLRARKQSVKQELKNDILQSKEANQAKKVQLGNNKIAYNLNPAQSQLQVQQLHYEMVRAQQKCKQKKCG